MSKKVWILVLSSEIIFHLGNGEHIPFVCTSVPNLKTQIIEAIEHSDIGLRSFLLEGHTHWPGGRVPYEIDPSFSSMQVGMIKEAMNAIKDISCVRWVPRKKQKDYVKFVSYPVAGVCNSQVGRVGDQQDINLNDLCFNISEGYKGAILHEMMHALGFIHEQQRLDRDCYVRVSLNAIEELPGDYAKVPKTSLQFPYDFNSIMHYGTSEHLKAKNKNTLGQRDGLFTELDIMKLNYMYCGGKTYCQSNSIKCALLEENAKKCLA